MELIIDKELFQWEKDRAVHIISSLEEPQISCVQFYNKRVQYGPEVPLLNGSAKIPNFLLEEPYPIMALACIGEPGDTKVIARKEFKVIKRTKPEQYEEEEEEKYVIYDGGEEM